MVHPMGPLVPAPPDLVDRLVLSQRVEATYFKDLIAPSYRLHFQIILRLPDVLVKLDGRVQGVTSARLQVRVKGDILPWPIALPMRRVRLVRIKWAGTTP